MYNYTVYPKDHTIRGGGVMLVINNIIPSKLYIIRVVYYLLILVPCKSLIYKWHKIITQLQIYAVMYMWHKGVCTWNEECIIV